MLFIGLVTTLAAYWIWGRLLRDYTPAQVVPFALLVPFVGSAASSIVFGETFGPLRLAGMITVVGGIARDAAVEAFPSLAEDRMRPDRCRTTLLIAFFVFAAVMYFTPGPNNIMVLSSGLTYGFRPTVPHIAGITIGCAFMVAARGSRIRDHFRRLSRPADDPQICRRGLSDLSGRRDRDVGAGRRRGRTMRRGPMTFWGAVLFQWVNVKGWVMVIGTITAYAGIASFPWNIVIQVLFCLLMGVASTSIWTLSGSSLRSLMTSPRAVRAFNIVMAALLLASLYPVFMDA